MLRGSYLALSCVVRLASPQGWARHLTLISYPTDRMNGGPLTGTSGLRRLRAPNAQPPSGCLPRVATPAWLRSSAGGGPYAAEMADMNRRARVQDVHELAAGMPDVTLEFGAGDNPVYQIGRKSFVFFRNPRPDAADPQTGERYRDVCLLGTL